MVVSGTCAAALPGPGNCPVAQRAAVSDSARTASISYAAYRLLRHRYRNSAGNEASFAIFDQLMAHYGLDPDHVSTAYASDGSPASLGNYIADCVIRFGLQDGSNEADGYRARYYPYVNEPLDPTVPASIATLVDPDRWQKLDLPFFVTKTGDTIPPPDFETPEWGKVQP